MTVCERLFYNGLLVCALIRLRVPAKYREFLFATLTSAFMSLIITLIIAAVDAGLSHRFWDLWLRGLFGWDGGGHSNISRGYPVSAKTRRQIDSVLTSVIALINSKTK